MRYILFIAFFALYIQIIYAQENQVGGNYSENYPDDKEEFKEFKNFIFDQDVNDAYLFIKNNGQMCFDRIKQYICTRELINGKFKTYHDRKFACEKEVEYRFEFSKELFLNRYGMVTQQQQDYETSQPYFHEVHAENKQCLMETYYFSKLKPTWREQILTRFCYRDIFNTDCQNLEKDEETMCKEELIFSRYCILYQCFDVPSYNECAQKCRHLKHPSFYQKWSKCKLTGEGSRMEHILNPENP